MSRRGMIRLAKTLASLGHTSLLEVDGGMQAWEAAGYELIRR